MFFFFFSFIIINNVINFILIIFLIFKTTTITNCSEINLNLRHLVFQKTRRQCPDIFDIPYYKMVEKYFQLLGQDPRLKNEFRNFIVTVVVISISGNIVPTVRKSRWTFYRNEESESSEFLRNKIKVTLNNWNH